MKKILLTATLLILLGCQQQNADTAPPNAASSVADSGECQADNLLKNPGFSSTGGVPDEWGFSQHAGELAYQVSTADGELHIDKTGEQHWMQITQRVGDPKVLAGGQAVFSAELKMNMHADGWTQALEPGGGLSIFIKGTEPGAPLRQKTLLVSNLQHEPKLGEFDWTPVEVSFAVPEGVTQIELGFLHQAYGQMAVRNPVLRAAGQADCR